MAFFWSKERYLSTQASRALSIQVQGKGRQMWAGMASVMLEYGKGALAKVLIRTRLITKNCHVVIIMSMNHLQFGL